MSHVSLEAGSSREQGALCFHLLVNWAGEGEEQPQSCFICISCLPWTPDGQMLQKEIAIWPHLLVNRGLHTEFCISFLSKSLQRYFGSLHNGRQTQNFLGNGTELRGMEGIRILWQGVCSRVLYATSSPSPWGLCTVESTSLQELLQRTLQWEITEVAPWWGRPHRGLSTEAEQDSSRMEHWYLRWLLGKLECERARQLVFQWMKWPKKSC